MISALDRNPANCVLVDLSAGDSAITCIARVRERFPLMPILALAKDAEVGDIKKAIKQGANHFVPAPEEPSNLIGTLSRLLNFRMEHLRYIKVVPYIKSTFEAIIPSEIELLGGIVYFLTEEMFKHGIIGLQQINVKVALVEAVTNAMEHGNKLDSSKVVKIQASFTSDQAVIDIIDEGDGFDLDALPNPVEKKNLFLTRGRGVFMMRQFLDEVEFHAPGNHVTVVKKRTSFEPVLRPYPWERRTT